MADEQLTVGDYVSLQRGTTYAGSLVGKPGPALLGLGSIEPGGGFRHDYQTYGGDCPANLMCFPGDLYAALKGATKDGKMIGSVARVPPSVSSGRLTQDTVKLVFHKPKPDQASYLYWVLRTPQYRAYCGGHAMGSAVVALSRIDFLNYPVPSLTIERQSLVALFDAIEERIEVNRQMSGTLEETARAIFKAWFVDFEPVRAKIENRWTASEALLGLPADLYGLFPARFSTSVDGVIPDGWHRTTLLSCAQLNPESWSKQTAPEEVNYVDLANTKWGIIETTTKYLWEDAPSRAQRVVRSGDTIVGMVRPGNGSYALIFDDGLTASTGFAILRPEKRHYVEAIYLAATATENIDRLAHLADGGAYPAVRPEVVAATSIVCPPDPIMERFSQITSTLLQRASLNRRACQTLAEIRDTLLPKLITGEIQLKKAEHLVRSVS